jgi:hypothetical protein
MLRPTTEVPEFSHLRKRDDVVRLLAPGAVGIELGVAEAEFAFRALSQDSIGFLYGVDMYAGDRGHDIDQYKRALRRLLPFQGRSALLHVRFDQALDLFPDETFDFIFHLRGRLRAHR